MSGACPDEMMAVELQNLRPGRPVSRIPLDATPTSTQNVRLCGKPVSRADGQLTVQNGGYRTRRERLLVTVCNLTPGTG
jgi:hypothetical protein